MPRSGTLRRRVTIERATTSQDGFGEPDPTWAELATRWAEIETLAGREVFGSDLEMSEQPTRFRFRYDTTVGAMTAKDRITYDSRTFDLISVQNQGERNRWMEVVGVVRG